MNSDGREWVANDGGATALGAGFTSSAPLDVSRIVHRSPVLFSLNPPLFELTIANSSEYAYFSVGFLGWRSKNGW
jgi:hypothetical protein